MIPSRDLNQVRIVTLRIAPQIIQFVQIPAGSFQMGSKLTEINRGDDETQHLVTLTKDFEMAITPTTQAQWRLIMGNNPSTFQGESLPVENVSWNDCQEFIQKLNAKNDGYRYSLPTEAEWEYACRAGSETSYNFGDDISKLGEYAWYNKNSYNKTQDVAKLKPNAFGLYDMHGNVWEWCQDWYGEYSKDHVVDPTGPISGSYRVFRGGSWCNVPQCLRSAFRYAGGADNRISYVGFRLVRTLLYA